MVRARVSAGFPLWAAVLLLIAGLPAVSGCIERSYLIRTDPPGALVVVDGEEVGTSPVTRKFLHYGTRQIILSKADHKRKKVSQPIEPPWYERFPLGFVVEMVWPGTVYDRRVFTYALEPLGTFEKDALLERAEELKSRAGMPGDAP